MKNTTELTREQRIDLAYELAMRQVKSIETSKNTECVCCETTKEGRINFSYRAYFCDDKNNQFHKTIKITTKGFDTGVFELLKSF